VAYCPNDADWFTATLVVEIRVSGYRRSVVHLNTVLVAARNREQAFRKALALGRFENQRYLNPKNQLVRCRFVGIHHLDIVLEPLRHGCELFWKERVGLRRDSVRRFVRKKTDLPAFAPVQEIPGRPNCASRDILRAIQAMMKKDRDRTPAAHKQRRRRRVVAKGRPNSSLKLTARAVRGV